MSQRELRGIRSAQAGLLINAALAVVKVITGILGNSYALIADGVESTTDIFSSLIVWRGLHVASRSPDEEYHFGYGKAESLSAAVVSLMLVGAAVGIAIQAIREIRVPHHLPAPFTLVVLVIVMLAKEILFRRVASIGAEIDSTAVTADAQHHRADALTSFAAFVGISIALVGGEQYSSADDYAALIAACMIMYSGITLIRPAIADLMDRAPDAGLIRRVETTACAITGVCAVEKTMARRAGGGYRVVMHVQADPELSLREAHILGGMVRRHVVSQVPQVLDVVIHMEPFE
ncbi:MAG: cation diffusion facilitator family transporter [Longimicrobiales bacterium]